VRLLMDKSKHNKEKYKETEKLGIKELSDN